MNLSSAKKKYLFAICKLGIDGNEVQSKDIANFLDVKRPSTSKMLNALCEENLIQKEYYGKVLLTENGLRIANKLYTNYLLLHTYFHNILHVSDENASKDAIICICDFSDEGVDRMVSEVILKQKSGELKV